MWVKEISVSANFPNSCPSLVGVGYCHMISFSMCLNFIKLIMWTDTFQLHRIRKSLRSFCCDNRCRLFPDVPFHSIFFQKSKFLLISSVESPPREISSEECKLIWFQWWRAWWMRAVGSGRFVYGRPKENVNVMSPNMRLAKLYESKTFIQIPFNCLCEAKRPKIVMKN